MRFNKMASNSKFGIFALIAIASVPLLMVVADENATKTCLYNGIDIEVGNSISAPIGECRRVTCQKSGSISAVGCSVQVPTADCKNSEYDYTKVYPDCCPKNIC